MKNKKRANPKPTVEELTPEECELDLQIWNGSPYRTANIDTPQRLQAVLKKASANLKYINLTRRNIEWPFILQIADRQYPNLQHLALDGNQLGVKGCKYFSQASWKQLSSLQIKQNLILNEGLAHLAKTHLPELDLISLKLNKIGDSGVVAFLKNAWTKLRIIYLQENDITINGMKWFLCTQGGKETSAVARLYLSKIQTIHVRTYMTIRTSTI